ncbi:MAG: hypothetical protein ACQEP3_03110 [Patescibacteria group bacterium]
MSTNCTYCSKELNEEEKAKNEGMLQKTCNGCREKLPSKLTD